MSSIATCLPAFLGHQQGQDQRQATLNRAGVGKAHPAQVEVEGGQEPLGTTQAGTITTIPTSVLGPWLGIAVHFLNRPSQCPLCHHSHLPVEETEVTCPESDSRAGTGTLVCA